MNAAEKEIAVGPAMSVRKYRQDLFQFCALEDVFETDMTVFFDVDAWRGNGLFEIKPVVNNIDGGLQYGASDPVRPAGAEHDHLSGRAAHQGRGDHR